MARTIYLTQDDGILGKNGEGFSWKRSRAEPAEKIPATNLGDVVVVGNGSISTPALHLLMEQDIPVHFISAGGRYKGSLTSGMARGYALRHAQYDSALSPDGALNFARAFVIGKILNQRQTLMRFLYRRRRGEEEFSSAARELSAFARNATRTENLEELRGVEGNAARVYFSVMGNALIAPWSFQGRTRRPPRDPVNALLSFCYTLLLGRVTTAVVTVGLDPCVGWLHPEYRGRPSAALDLMEEFRSATVDRFVVSILNQNFFSPRHFTADKDGGVRIEQGARQKLMRLFKERLRTEVRNSSNDHSSSYENHIHAQAWNLARCIRNGGEYLPFVLRL